MHVFLCIGTDNSIYIHIYVAETSAGYSYKTVKDKVMELLRVDQKQNKKATKNGVHYVIAQFVVIEVIQALVWIRVHTTKESFECRISKSLLGRKVGIRANKSLRVSLNHV
jgi:hypothetical protein